MSDVFDSTLNNKRRIKMKTIKKAVIVVGCAVVLIIVVAIGYKIMFSQGTAETVEVNSSELDTKVLIATQESEFKNALVSGIIENLKKQPIYIKVIDVSGLAEVKEDRWQAIVIINTCEMYKMQSDVRHYLSQAEEPDKVVLLTTSGPGDWKPKDSSVDSISSASKMTQVDSLVVHVLDRLNRILGDLSQENLLGQE